MQALVEKDWLAFGHPFSDRMGMPAISGSVSVSFELSRQSSAGSFPSSPMRQSSGSYTSQPPCSSHAQTSNNYSPIFLQVCIVVFSYWECQKIWLTILRLLFFLNSNITSFHGMLVRSSFSSTYHVIICRVVTDHICVNISINLVKLCRS